MKTEHIDLWIITGFLGSGKTTLINSLLNSKPEGMTGIVVNDFGEIGIDTGLITRQKGIDIAELNGGQIFCSCLSGDFVKALAVLAEKNSRYILVESSGLAKPSVLDVIIRQAVKESGDRIRFQGMICLIDAARYQKLLGTVNAVEEQLRFADLALINKCDLVSSEKMESIRESIRKINPLCEIRETSYSSLDFSSLPAGHLKHSRKGSSRFAGWGESGRPAALTFKPEVPLSSRKIKALIEALNGSAMRIKGYLKGRDGDFLISVSGGQREIKQLPPANGGQDRRYGITVIVPGSEDVRRETRERYKKALVEL